MFLFHIIHRIVEMGIQVMDGKKAKSSIGAKSFPISAKANRKTQVRIFVNLNISIFF